MNKNVNYGNWVPEKMLALCYVAAAVLGIAACVTGPVLHLAIPTWILGILAAICLVYGIYMHICHELFAFGKGNMMAKVHQHLVDHLEWDGEGTLLDIGCGAAALTIRCAKAFPKAKLVGMDYWGAEWNYAKEQCEANAKAEGVADRITFHKGDAAHLEDPDETFDATVSNFVFHEVRSAKDKRDVVREALRIVKKGGAFSFQDMFSQKSLYGDMEEFVEELKKEGITEIHYIGNLEKKLDFIPGCSLDDLRNGNPVRAEIIIPLAEIPAKKQSFPADLLHPQKVPSASPLQLQNPHIRLLLKW